MFIACLYSTRAAEISFQIVDVLNHQPIQNATIAITVRQIHNNYLAPLAFSPPTLTPTSDATGHFTIDVPEGFIAIQITHPNFADYLDTLLKIDSTNKKLFTIELQSANPTAAESQLIEQRHTEAQLIARFEKSSDPETIPDLAALTRENIAAAQPTVPTEVWMSNLNGFTGYMNLDEYIAGVVSLEMGDGFPYEALKAQAVAARTYALARLRDRGYANGGQAYTSTLGSRSSAAAFNSSGVALTYQRSYISAFFSARCNGDFTLDSEDGLSGLSTCTVGGLVGGAVIPYLRKVPCSGHINCSQTTESCCHVTVDGRDQHIYGHGVGFCQRGAQNFAGRDGVNWQEIVNRYYTSVTTLPGQQLTLGDRIQMLTTANKRTVPCSGTTSSAAQGSTGTIIAGPQTIPCTLITGTSYITWWRVAYDNGSRGWVAEDFVKKSPAIQTLPDLQLSVTSTNTSSAQITATARANLRVILLESQNLTTWTPIATNTLSTAGATTFTRSTPGFYRAELQLPDTAP